MSLLDQFIFSEIAPPSSEALIPRFREWWWNELDTGADSAEFDAGTTESAQELLPTLRGLVWPDFGVRAEGTLLCLNRACVHHYPHDENPDIEDQDA